MINVSWSNGTSMSEVRTLVQNGFNNAALAPNAPPPIGNGVVVYSSEGEATPIAANWLNYSSIAIINSSETNEYTSLQINNRLQDSVNPIGQGYFGSINARFVLANTINGNTINGNTISGSWIGEVIPVNKGGTGASNAANALTGLGINVNAEFLNSLPTTIDEIRLAPYPIGSIYTTINPTNPGSVFGGTWERFAEGKTLIGVDTTQTDFNEANKTGGASTHKHAISSHSHTVTIPSTNLAHSHTIPSQITTYGEIGLAGFATGDTLAVTSSTTTQGTSFSGTSIKGTTSTLPKDNSASASSLPPYITVYFWKRVS